MRDIGKNHEAKIYVKNKLIRIKSSQYLVYAIISAMMAVIFCMIYGVHILDFTYTDWILESNNDLTQHYLGWKAYQLSDVTWPIGVTDRLAHPTHTSIIFTDSIPCLANVFKIMTPILPAEFQYFGLWGIISFILQGVISARIISHYTDNKAYIVLVSVLFVFTPVMIYRMFMHTALAGHWILLLALESLFAYKVYQQVGKKAYITWAIIGGLSAAIHIYLLLMCGMILLGYCLAVTMASKKVKQSILCLMVYLISAVAVVGVEGGFFSGFSETAGHLGDASLNINALFNPQNRSHIFQNMSLYGNYQYEGFAYLGAGCILLLFLSIVTILESGKIREYIKRYYILHIALAFTFLLAFVFALSPKITCGDKLIYEMKLPNILEKCWAVFRSTGRFVWVCIYILMICTCIVCSRLFSKRTALIIMLICIFLQIYDIKDVLSEKNDKFDQVVRYETLLKDTDFWDQIAADDEIKNIILTEPISNKEMFSFTDWALDNGKMLIVFILQDH